MTAASTVVAVPAVGIAAAIAARTEVTELVAQLGVERLLERDADDVTATGAEVRTRPRVAGAPTVAGTWSSSAGAASLVGVRLTLPLSSISSTRTSIS